jgi:hypothetical protein
MKQRNKSSSGLSLYFVSFGKLGKNLLQSLYVSTGLL